MTYTNLISTDNLANHLEDPEWVVVDCRFNLQQPDWGEASYLEAHIPGAVYAHLDRDLAGPKLPGSGRHPLPEPAVWVARLSRWGIGPGKQVVAYDTVGGAFAARLWWLLKYYGFEAAAVLDGGFERWQREGHPVRSGAEAPPQPAEFHGEPRPWMVLGAKEVAAISQDTAWRLVDARSAERFLGQQEPIDPVAGHIPGAINRFHGENLGKDGSFLSPEALRADYEAILGKASPQHVAVYCGSGVTSCHHLLAMDYAGLKGGKLYPGSWSEWIQDPSRPVEKSQA